ncbi:Ste24 endopeptidase [Pilimelia anulata]|uniref:Ste24 endopeptidase n=1 Tax=Pilimelia anulata TaxID=53371 RepID=A0A8J3F724_9ACTN|nr:M48 family metallopeptidase [Pilimelia anulata]GGJ85074.1 Ste24 endopeptidase [Pilimelia anulata]
MTSRTWAVLTLIALVVGLALAVALLTPWHRVPAPRADQLAALRDLPADQVDRGRAFAAALRPGRYLTMGLGLAVALVLGLTPLGAHLVELLARPFGGAWWARVLCGGLGVLLVADVVTLPLAAWRQSILVRYGISTQDWGSWLVDVLKGYGVAAVLGLVVLFGWFGLLRLAPRWWWAFGAGGAAALVVVFSFVLPVLVEPVFNRFTPMPASPLRTELMALAERDGVPVREVLVADASRRTRAVNAYVSGLGPTRRIVVYDTLLREAPPAEIVAVAAHELGHAEDRDVLSATVTGALAAAAGVVLLYLLGSWTGLLRAAGVDGLGDPRAVGLLLALTAVAGLLLGPVQAYASRRIEARADAHALALTGDPAAYEAMQRRLAGVNLSDPDPPYWEHALFGSHPTTVERIAAARAYARGQR